MANFKLVQTVAASEYDLPSMEDFKDGQTIEFDDGTRFTLEPRQWRKVVGRKVGSKNAEKNGATLPAETVPVTS